MKKLKKQYKITVVMPCFGRPARTRRAIESILHQSITGWEAFIIGDGCPYFQELIDSGAANQYKDIAESNGNLLHIFNLEKQRGGYGYWILNYALKNATGEYFIFMGNDDIILFNHFEHYLSEIQGTDLDLVYYNTFINPSNQIRISELKENHIGHSEIILRTEFAKKFKHKKFYGHDWKFIESISNSTDKIKKAESSEYSYMVMHVPGLEEEFLD